LGSWWLSGKSSTPQLSVEQRRQPDAGDKKTPSFVEQLHGGDDVKVTERGVVVSLAFVDSLSSGLARAFVASPRP